MPETPNHEYNVPSEGEQDWHEPLNENFRQFDADVEIRDENSNKGSYEPKAGAKYLATDTGRAYVGDGSTWQPLPTTGTTPTLSGLNLGGAPLGVGTGSPAARLDVAGGNNWNVTNGPGDFRVGDATHRLKVGVALGGGGAGISRVRTQGGAEQLRLGAGDEDVLTVEPDGASVGADPGDRAATLEAESTTGGDVFTMAVRGVTAGGEGYRIGVEGRTEGEGGAGVRGVANSTTGAAEGVRGIARGPDSAALSGWASHDEGVALFANGRSKVTGGLEVGGDLDVAGTKNFVQAVDTDDGEKEVVYTATEAGTPHTEASGVAELDGGRTEIDLPDHFGWVTSGEAPLHVQTTPYSADSEGLAVVERSRERLVVEDRDGEGDYEFSYTVKGTREGHADKEVVREPSASADRRGATSPADD